ncbi:hypothetical protein [Stenotrophomonas phage RAS14]
MSHKTFQQQWVLDPVWASDCPPEVKNAVRNMMREDGNGAARKIVLRELTQWMHDPEVSEEENAENFEFYKDDKVLYDYIKSVAPDLPEDTEFLVYNWW